MSAGRDTTAQALSWMTYLLAKNPLAEERLVKEVSGAILLCIVHGSDGCLPSVLISSQILIMFFR